MLQKETIIGSDEKCGIQLSGKAIMKRHARLLYHEGTFFVESIGAKCPVFVEGEKVREKELVPLTYGTRLRIGDADLTFSKFSQKLD